MPIPAVQQNAVFLNFPYDARFSRLYLASLLSGENSLDSM
jgi:hypothetical protein